MPDEARDIAFQKIFTLITVHGARGAWVAQLLAKITLQCCRAAPYAYREQHACALLQELYQ